MDSISVLIAEDEKRQRDRLAKLVDAQPDYQVVATCQDGKDALEQIRLLKPALALLDIQMPEMSGIEVLENLENDEMPAVIFVTAYDQYALKAFELHATDYLLKPFDDERLTNVLDRCKLRVRKGEVEKLGKRLLDLLAYFKEENTGIETGVPEEKQDHLDRLAIRIGGKILLLRVDEIDWIAGAGVYVEVHTGTKRYHLRESLSRLEEKLDDKMFVRIHRSHIVNINRVKELVPHFHGEYNVILHDGTQLKLSRSYREKLDSLLGTLS